jgi:hypothetical protein
LAILRCLNGSEMVVLGVVLGKCGDRLLCESASLRVMRVVRVVRVMRVMRVMRVLRVVRVMQVMRVFHCFSSLNAFYSMLVYKLSNNISLILNPYISFSSLISDSLYLLILKYISVLSAVFIEIFQHNQQHDTLLPISPARIT